MAYGTVGVSVHHAVDLGKKIPELKFDTLAKMCSVGKADTVAAESKSWFPWQGPVGAGIAHVAMHSMHFFVSKDFEHAWIGQVSGMDDNAAVIKTVVHGPDKLIVRADKMGVGNNACLKGHGRVCLIGLIGFEYCQINV